MLSFYRDDSLSRINIECVGFGLSVGCFVVLGELFNMVINKCSK